MLIFFIVLSILLFITTGFFVYISYNLHKKLTDLESFIINFNDDIHEFKQSVDRITKSQIMVYDELVFDVMNQCKIIKQKVDAYLTKYDDYGKYVYTEDIGNEPEQQEMMGIIRPGPSV